MAVEREHEHISDNKPDRLAYAEESATRLVTDEPPISTAAAAGVLDPLPEKPDATDAEPQSSSLGAVGEEKDSDSHKAVPPMYGVNMKLSKEQVKDLLAKIGDHSAQEHEWIRACHLLGDYNHEPRKGSRKAVIALAAAAAIALCIGVPWYNNYVQNNQAFDMVPPPPPVAADADYASYIDYMQDRVKGNWNAKHVNASHVPAVVQFKLDPQGHLSNLSLFKTSGLAGDDAEAMKAIAKSAPFKALPEGASEKVDMQMTFDENTFNRRGPAPEVPLEPGQPAPENSR